MTNPMLAELDEVVTKIDAFRNLPFDAERRKLYTDASSAATEFLRTHHATLADMAKRLEAAEEAYRKMLAGIDAEQLVAASKKHGDALSVLKDAGRYRHFRRQIATGRCEILHDLDVGYPLHADDPVGTLERFIDSKLDAAIAATQEGEG